MDVLRKELNEIYEAQDLKKTWLDKNRLEKIKIAARHYADITQGCSVLTDASNDTCFISMGLFGKFLGLTPDSWFYLDMNSSDEDLIYERIHPEDLVDKRMLEYEFFKFIDKKILEDKEAYKASCTIRIKDSEGNYINIDNTTQIASLAYNCKFWLILCTYNISPDPGKRVGINPKIVSLDNGEIIDLDFSGRREQILTKREKEILGLIKTGKLSKEIASELNISLNTVNRHRQNILEKLSVGNSMEAVKAAEEMRLL